jgi:hypothetical protein
MATRAELRSRIPVRELVKSPAKALAQFKGPCDLPFRTTTENKVDAV